METSQQGGNSPGKANWLELVVRIDGIGELNFKDVQVYEQD